MSSDEFFRTTELPTTADFVPPLERGLDPSAVHPFMLEELGVVHGDDEDKAGKGLREGEGKSFQHQALDDDEGARRALRIKLVGVAARAPVLQPIEFVQRFVVGQVLVVKHFCPQCAHQLRLQVGQGLVAPA